VQTITIPYVASDDDKALIAEWQRLHACVVRTGYARAVLPDGTTMPEKDLRNLLKKLFPTHPLGSWAIHCATREALRMRKQQPNGKIIFGGRKQFERRTKGLISKEDWRHRRQSRPIEIVGDRTRDGNRHIKLSSDGLKATVGFLGRTVTLNLPQMSGKTGCLIKALALLTNACEVGVGFTLGSGRLTITFDPMDLRKLPPGMTLEQVQKAEREALGHKPRGRPRNDPDTHDSAYKIRPVDHAIRPVHPEWRPSIPIMASRAVGIDLNPQWIGLTVIEIDHHANARDADTVRILDHRLIRIDMPISSSSEALATHMARVARVTAGLARKWHAATIFHEDGLGKLRWSKKSRGEPAAQTINHWSRNALIGGLARRCALSGLTLSPIWGGYSTTIGNMCFDLPDACGAAAEIARRGIAATRGDKDRLPVVPRTVPPLPGKDGAVPEVVAKAMAQAGCWRAVHRTVKAAQIDVRRPHPPLQAADPGPFDHAGRRYAVRRQGSRKSGHLTVAAAPIGHVA
jgi:hypothetical protein